MRLPIDDLELITESTASLWSAIKGENIFITGGTGFFGIWLLESFIAANEKYNLKSKLYVLTRNILSFKKKAPHLIQNSSLIFIEGDIQSVLLKPEINISYIIHGATSASAILNTVNPLLMYDTIVKGTRRILDIGLERKVRKILFISSGAVYGKQPHDISHIDEDYIVKLNINNSESAYGFGKASAEFLCSTYSKLNSLNVTIARCFAFIGPWLPLNTHFAMGNFIKNKIEGRPIKISGDGTPYRSYMYMADLAIWLWTLLFKGKNGEPYNVGSEKEYSIYEIAKSVDQSFKPFCHIDMKSKYVEVEKTERYIPFTKKAQFELGLKETFSLDESILKTINWYRKLVKPD